MSANGGIFPAALAASACTASDRATCRTAELTHSTSVSWMWLRPKVARPNGVAVATSAA